MMPGECPDWVDSVEKVGVAYRSRFFRAAGAPMRRGREGPRHLSAFNLEAAMRTGHPWSDPRAVTIEGTAKVSG